MRQRWHEPSAIVGGKKGTKAGFPGSSSELGPPLALCDPVGQVSWARGQLLRGAGKDGWTGVMGGIHGSRQAVHGECDPRHFPLVRLTHLAGVQRLTAPCKSKTKLESTDPEKEGGLNSQLTAKACHMPGRPPNILFLGSMPLGR